MAGRMRLGAALFCLFLILACASSQKQDGGAAQTCHEWTGSQCGWEPKYVQLFLYSTPHIEVL
jgi:hypothetical protein